MFKPIRGGTFVLAVIFSSGVVSLPVLNWHPAAAAEVFRKSFDYGIFINNRRTEAGNAPIAVSASKTVRIQGWVIDANTRKPGSALLCAVDGGVPAPVADYPLPRPDVAAAEHDQGALKSGFELPIDVATLSAGVHRFHFILVGENASRMQLAPDVQLSVGR